MTTRLDAFRKLLTHVRERLGLDPGFVLWDDSTVPENLPRDALAIRIADEGVVASLLRRPNLATICNLWVAGRLDILNGTIFDMVAARPKIRSRDTRKVLDKGFCSIRCAGFCFCRAADRGRLRKSKRRKSLPRATPRAIRKTSSIITICQIISIRFFSIPRWSIPARTSQMPETISPPRNATSWR